MEVNINSFSEFSYNRASVNRALLPFCGYINVTKARWDILAKLPRVEKLTDESSPSRFTSVQIANF
jgi:hypothetical protein